MAYTAGTDRRIVGLTLESCGIRGTGRLLKISPKTVLARIVRIADGTSKPMTRLYGKYEVDEMRLYVKAKRKKKWLTYALDIDKGEVADFRIGGRGKKSIGLVCKTLLLSEARKIHTDGYPLYGYLIPNNIHSKGKRGTNHIERRNLDLRHSLKRLSRKTIAFTKSIRILESILKIYFWYDRSQLSLM